MNLPVTFPDTTTESFVINDLSLEIPKCTLQFEAWKGVPVRESFGGKAVLQMGGRPMFAELVILQHFSEAGWEARWVETYGRGNKEPICLSAWADDIYKNQVHDPIADESILNTLKGIAKLNGNKYAGCWDILAWKGKDLVFAESKRRKKDRLRPSQNSWLAAGLEYGLSVNNFLVVEWDIIQEVKPIL